MLDVHAPEHPIFSPRDFFIHLLTITIGLLIALGLEQTEEWAHHRHQKREAEMMIREELRDNRKSLQDSVKELMAERKAMAGAITQLREQVKNKQDGKMTAPQLDFREQEIPDAAWRTASSTGVLEFLPYDEVSRFADAYREQALLQSMEQKTLEDYLELTAGLMPGPDADKAILITQEDAVRMLPLAQRTMGHLNGILAAGTGTLPSYDSALK